MAKLKTYVMLPTESRKDLTIGYELKEIVRCCECRYQETCIHSTSHGDDEDGEHGFCSWGKPKDGEQE